MIVFCTTCKGRAEHIKRTLPQNLKDNPGPESKFVLVDYNSQDDLTEYLRSNHMADIATGKLVVYSYRRGHPFRMAHAKNMAHRLGIEEGGDILVNLDADNFTGENFDSYVWEKFTFNRNCFLWANRNQPVEIRYPKGCNGRIVVTKEAFINAGGYDEKQFPTWGPDDKDFNTRLRRLGYQPAEIARRFLDVILHTDKMRFRDYPIVEEETYDNSTYITEDGVRIANFGNFGCGHVYRNFDPFDNLHLAPMPTRVFGIGMHKTATTSLHHAFQILGFESAHWPSAHWAKKVFHDMREVGSSTALERYYSACDLPIPLLYKELDKAYPNSKFVLTTRDDAGWLETVAKHWDEKYNPFRAGWDADPFTNKIHTELYGRKKFDAGIFLDRYRRHNAEVREYFAGRSDLLEMKMDEGAGWPQLCEFLGKPRPLVPYPRSFAKY